MTVAALLALWLGGVTGAAFLVSWFGTGVALRALRVLGAVAHPNARSSHTVPTPNGGGVAPVAALLLAWGLAALTAPAAFGAGAAAPERVLVIAAALAAMSFFDDLGRRLSPAVRLGAQVLAVAGGLATVPPGILLGLPVWAEVAFTGLAWLWFINLFNFMDGIDGLAGTETIAIGFGAAVVAALLALAPIYTLYGLTAAAAALGFLMWNWRPAKVFLGDVGSVPLGYLLGWLLLQLAAHGGWAAALLLPLFFVADATVTLLRRLMHGAAPWRAHREHFYQRAAAAVGDHAAVVLWVASLDAALVTLALAATIVPTAATSSLAAGATLTAALLWYLARRSALAPPAEDSPRR